MYYPRINSTQGSRIVTNTFAGYNHNLRIADGVSTSRKKIPLELYHTENLSTRRYPLLCPRQPRGTLETNFANLQAIIAKDALYWIDNGTLYANGLATGLTGLKDPEGQPQRPRKMVSMGAYICVFPDKKYINTANLTEFGDMGAIWSRQNKTVSYQMCHQDGTVYENVTKRDSAPENPSNGDIWIDVSDGNTAKEYSAFSATWVMLETVFTKVTFTTDGQMDGQLPALFKEYDGVQISGLSLSDLNGSKILYAVGNESNRDYIVLVGIADVPSTHTEAEVRVERKIPDMDYVCEAQNRLWGCFYGNDGTQNLNEIYCCALGDFHNWEQYLGVSTDSWRGSRGSDGKFTGCINYLGQPTFFKENVIHPVSVSPIGAHQIDDIPARGVQDGSWQSLAIVDETLYYKSRSGVMAYQGGIPMDVGAALGEEKYYSAVAGSFGSRYYLSMKDAQDAWHLFCLDVKTGLWMREDNLHVEQFASWGDELYAQTGNHILALNGTEGVTEGRVDWIAETGILLYAYPDKKYVSRYDLRMSMEQDAKVQLYIEYDSSGMWNFQGEMRVNRTGSVTLPVRPRRCDHLRMRLEGRGEVSLFSIARVMEQGSDA